MFDDGPGSRYEFNCVVMLGLLLIMASLAQGAPLSAPEDPGVHARRYSAAFFNDHWSGTGLECRHGAARVVELARADGHEAEVVHIHYNPRVHKEGHAVPAVKFSDRWMLMDWTTWLHDPLRPSLGVSSEGVHRWWTRKLPMHRQWYRNRLREGAWVGITGISLANDAEVQSYLAERRLILKRHGMRAD